MKRRKGAEGKMEAYEEKEGRKGKQNKERREDRMRKGALRHMG